MQFQQEWAQLEQLTAASLQETNFAHKQEIDGQINHFMTHLPTNLYPDLFELRSPTALFVCVNCLYHAYCSIATPKETLLAIRVVIADWFQPEGSFLRHDQHQLDLKTSKTLGALMGRFLKRVILDGGNEGWLEQFLHECAPKPTFQLYLYQCFLEYVSEYDAEVGFTTYRTALHTMQTRFIPKIFDLMIPFFLRLHEYVTIEEISILQQHLTLRENQQPMVGVLAEKGKVLELTFTLLEGVLEFRYNITIGEYHEIQEENDFKISFPDAVLKHLTNQEFVQALYSVILVLIRGRCDRYLTGCLRCLKNLLLAKITYLPPQSQHIFISHNLEGVYNLTREMITNLTADGIILTILDCNIKALTLFTYDILNQVLDSPLGQQRGLRQTFAQWMNHLKTFCRMVLQACANSLNAQNQIFLKMVDVFVRVATVFKYREVSYLANNFSNFYQDFTVQFLKICCSGSQELVSRNLPLTEANQVTMEFFENVKCLMSFDFQVLFRQLCNFWELLKTSQANEQGRGNFILLIGALIENLDYFEEGILGENLIQSQSNPAIAHKWLLLGDLLRSMWSYCRQYIQSTNREGMYLNRCLILWLSNLIPRCVDNMTTTVSSTQEMHAEIKDRFYQAIERSCRRSHDPISGVSFTEEGIHFLYQLMVSTDVSSLEFVLELFVKLIKTLKKNMGKSDFKLTSIHQYLYDYLSKLHSTREQIQQVKWQRQLFMALSSLTLDDMNDAYRSSIRQIMDGLRLTFENQQYHRTLYALTGMLEAIDNQIIYRFFLGELCKIDLGELTKCFFRAARNDDEVKDALRVTYLMIANIFGRLQGNRSVFRLYSVIEKFIPIWADVLAHKGQQPDVFEGFVDISKAIFEEGMFNVCLLNQLQGFDVFLERLFNRAQYFVIELSQYPQMQEPMERFMEYVFTTEVSLALCSSQIEVIGNLLPNLAMTLMQKVNASAQRYQDQPSSAEFAMIIKAMDHYLEFIEYVSERRSMRILQHALADMMREDPIKGSFLLNIMKVGMSSTANLSDQTENIASVMIRFLRLHPSVQVHDLASQLDLKQIDTAPLECILADTHAEEQSFDLPWMVSRVKAWLVEPTRYVQDPDEY